MHKNEYYNYEKANSYWYEKLYNSKTLYRESSTYDGDPFLGRGVTRI